MPARARLQMRIGAGARHDHRPQAGSRNHAQETGDYSLGSTSCKEIAQEVLENCIAGKPPKELPHALIEEPCSAALFGVLVEGLADRFEPALCDAYARLFSQAIAHVTGADAAQFISRYECVRRVRPVTAEPKLVLRALRASPWAPMSP